MTDHKLVPVEPDVGMVGAGARVLRQLPGAEKLAKQVYRSMRAAAPVVQGEPLGYVVPRMAARLGKGELCGISVLDQPEDGHTLPVYLAPQPAEQQQPDDGLLTPAPDELFAAEFNAWWEQDGQFCRAGGGDYECTFAFEAWRYLYPRLVKLQTAAAEQQPLPCQECGGNGAGGEHEEDCSQQPTQDVAGLVEALTELCDEIDNHDIHSAISKTNILWFKRKARAALAAHRKGGGK